VRGSEGQGVREVETVGIDLEIRNSSIIQHSKLKTIIRVHPYNPFHPCSIQMQNEQFLNTSASKHPI
ncbi:MAG: hypothetical protein KAU91_01090, partial [Candidatus Aminicenantes bacterium]|nr:hypothetical protein [Candidatus Aminicenantes bacterium]